MLRNCWLKWFENRMQYRRLTGRSLGRRRRTLRHRPTAAFVGEALETRTLLTTYFVDTAVDVVDANDGLTSLREAITMAEADATADMIRFAPGLEGAVFNITQGPLPTITEDLQLLGTIGNAQSINGAGLSVEASGAGDITTFAMNSVNINLDPTGAGLQIDATDDGVANVTVFNSRIANSAAQGVNFVANTGGVVNLTMSVVAVLSNGDVVQSEGIRGQVGVGGGESNTTPGQFATANLNISSTTVANHFLEGFRLDVADGGIVTTTNAIRNSTFSNNGFGNQRSGVRFEVSGAGSSLQADFRDTAAHNVTGTGYEFRASAGSNLDIGMTNGAAQAAKADALTFLIDDSNATIDVDGFIALGNGDNGVEARLTNGATVAVNSFNNVTINDALRTGLKIGVLGGSTLSAFNATNVTVDNSGGINDTSDGSGVLLTTLDSVSTFNFTGLTSTNNLVRGVQIGVNQGGTSTKTFNNLVTTGNELAQPVGIGVGNNSVLTTTINGGSLTSAGALGGINNIYMPVSGNSTSNLTVDGVTLGGSTSSGIVATYDGASTGGTIDVRNSTSIGNNAVGIALFATNGADVDGNFENVNVSNAGQTTPSNGMRLEINGVGSTGDFTFDGVNADGAAGTGISLVYNNGAVGSVNQFDNVSAQNTGGDGVLVNVRGFNTTLSNFVANGVNVTGAGLGSNQNSDGLDITVAGPGAVGTFDFQNVIANVAGGRGVKVQVENTATATVDVDGFSADGNGLEGVAIDVGTVVAGAQLLGSAFTNGSASSNGQAFMVNRAGIRSNVRGTGSTADLEFGTVFVNSNTDDGLALTGEAGAMLSVDLGGGVTTVGNLANGVDFRGDGSTTTVELTASAAGNMYTGNGGAGLNVRLSNQVTANAINIQGDASLNQGDGMVIADDGSGVTINGLQVSGNSQMNTNQGNGLAISLDGALGLTSLDLSALTLSNNVGDQINVYLANMSLTDILLDDITAVGPGAGSGSGDGVELTLDSTAVTNSLALNRITTTDNGEDGLELTFVNGATIPVDSAIDVGTFNENGQHGVNLNVTDSAIALSLTNSTSAMENTVSSLSRNGMHGLNVTLNDAMLTMDNVDRQTIVANGGAGVNILGATPSDFISGNTFSNNIISNNLSFGFRGVFNGGTFDIAIGEAGAGNIFDNNTGAAIAIDQVQNSIGQLSIEDNQITDTNDGGAVFNGDGIFIRQLGTVNPQQATNLLTRIGGPGLLIQNNRIGVTNAAVADGNAGTGIIFQLEEDSQINGLHVFDNFVSNNGADGLNLRRLDTVDINNFQVMRNEFTDNGDDGFDLLGQNDTTDVMFVTIDDNEVSDNSDNGFSFQLNADARMNVNLDNNMIVDNGTDGIQTREVILDISDQRQLSGSWTNNTIANNTRNGVRIGGATSGLSVSTNHIGATFDQFGQVVMDGNGSTGIQIDGAGSSSWADNNIIRNGRLVQGDRSQGHGVDVQGAGFKSNTFSRNIIRENFQDGIEFNNNGGGDLPFTLTLNDNRIQQNAGRGLDVLNQGTTFTTVNIFSGSGSRVNNQFSSNGEEGIYVVNTASTTQNQTDFSGADLAQDGSLTNVPRLQLFLDEATISNNGSEGNNGMMIASAGILLRVGSSDAAPYLGSSSSSGSSQFATSGFSSSVINGGMFASLGDSSLHGNFGDDVFIHGYRSTAEPGTLGGTWSTMEFTVNGTGDPLARLDLQWGLSDYDSVDVNNATRRGTPDGEAGAFYNNAEGTFKSRTGNSDPSGPHQNNGAGRRRNAQRVPTRVLSNGTRLNPQFGTGGSFLYPGWGDSTFRVRSIGASLAEFGSVSFSPNTQTGELPFTWDGFAPTKQMSAQRTYLENGPPITIDSGAGSVADANHDSLNGGQGNYAGASYTVSREGGANAEDVFGFQNGNGLTLVGNTIQKAGSTIASFNQVGGTLTITFTSGFGQIPTTVDANNVLRQMTYANSSVVPPLPGTMPPSPSLTLNVVFTSGVPNQIPQSAVCKVAITIVPFNSQPQIINLGPAGTFGGNPVTLDVDQNVDIQDAELDFLNMGQGNYSTAVLTIRRDSAVNANDNFTFVNGNGLTLNGMNIQRAGQTIATFNNTNGLVTVTFTDVNGVIPRSVDADNILRQIRYNNTNATPPASVTLRVTIDDMGVGGGTAQQGIALVTVTNNSAPAIAGLGPADVFITGGPAVAIENNANATITDVELDALDNYDGSTLTIARLGGANTDDTFGFTSANGLNLVGNEIRKGGLAIATFNGVNGLLTVTFTDANGAIPTAADADNVLRQITYQNLNAAPPAAVTLQATFDDGGIGGVGNQQTTANVTVNINTTPTITNLGPANVYTTLGPPVLIDNDSNANITDLELDNLNNYANSVLMIARQGGANAEDTFSFVSGAGLSLIGNNIIKNGQAIASFNVNAGTLTIAFTDANGEAPTSVDVDNILRRITYANTNAAPPANVTLNVTFDDGGVGGVGSQQDTESVTVTIM